MKCPEFWGIVGLNILYYLVFPILQQRWKTWKRQRNAARNEMAQKQAVREEYDEILNAVRATSDRVYVIRRECEKYDPEKYRQPKSSDPKIPDPDGHGPPDF